jgi:hypothetical protein
MKNQSDTGRDLQATFASKAQGEQETNSKPQAGQETKRKAQGE